ncbi:histidine-containing phosphotransfer protein 1-like [Citrus sinensis]|uniref:histidine-containing phosphotransfer protein 1-like n=1 Tax=Citrus sinensis TaxID=2711 RepID=UPI000D6267DC|nr:histidine-containing phosphotransfer protein 1-like [Citrus sinensis]
MAANASSFAIANLYDEICSTILNRQKHKTIICYMGILSDQNSHIQTLTMVEEPYYAEQLINTYCTSVEAILLQLTSCIELRDVDFSQLAVLARQIEEKSSRFGAEHVRRACADLIRACDQMHKRAVSRALAWLKNEYTLTKNKLQSVAQMERRIMRLLLKEEKRQQQP